jgi:L-ascorbate metabolism protein UlaG (beta-lactamase superfamily)
MNANHGLSITWLGHATVLYRSSSGKSVLVDPWMEGNPASPPDAKKLDAVDIMLITHGHGDHFNNVLAIEKQFHPTTVCNFEISLYLETKGVTGKVHGINTGGSVTLDGIRVTMVPAFHSSSIQDGDKVHPAGDPCGFVIRFEDGQTVYHAGDTGFFGDMKWIGELYRPSVAVLPIGDYYTMGPREAAVAAKLIGAKRVIPIHHSTFPGLTGTPDAFRKELADQREIEVVELKPGETAGAELARR